MRILLTMIRLMFKILFLPVRAVLHIVAFVLKILLGIGSIPTSIMAGICYLLVIMELLEGKPFTEISVWLTFVTGIIFSAFPYIGAVVVAIPLTIAELLKRFTSPHPFQDLELEGGNFHEA